MTKMDKLSEKASREWRADARAAHDDPLLDCLVEVTRLHGVATTAQALSAGLPLEAHRLTPALLPRAAARALSARVVKRALDEIPRTCCPPSCCCRASAPACCSRRKAATTWSATLNLAAARWR